jgi:hypothetical protein
VKKTQLKAVGDGGREIFLEAVQMYQNFGGDAYVSKFWRRCMCIKILEAVQMY